jgi:cobalamin biosynthetic protein CobC
MASDPRTRLAPLAHGGDLALARRLFPGAPEPFIDLSTGINPFAYPVPAMPPEALLRLPDPSAVQRLAATAADAYGAPSLACVVPAPGSQILFPIVAGLVPKGRAGVLATGYAEHARAAALAGHAVIEAKSVDELTACDLAIISNPNNPDGRTFPRASLLALATELERRHGMLVVDEAFMDIGPADASLAGDTDRPNIVVLRSFGKFFGLPGLRLGFALANPRTAAELAARLGPWAVSGPAIAVGEVALADRRWAITKRVDLAAEAIRLDQILIGAELEVTGGTSLFRLVVSDYAPRIFDHLGRAGIFVRRFARYPTWLRFGLPGNEEAWKRLRAAFAPGADSSPG